MEWKRFLERTILYHFTWAVVVLYNDAPSVKNMTKKIFFGGRGTRVMTPIHHLRMSHHPDAYESCTLMLPVSKHDAHLSPMERGQ